MSTGFSKHHNYLCREVRRSARRDKEQYIGVICDKIEKSRNQNKSREVFEAIRKLTGSYAPRPFAVKDKEGKLLNGKEKVKTRWREYFSELYNDLNEVDENSVQVGSCNLDPEPDIIISEVDAALQRLSNGKAAKHDNISAQELKASTEGKGMHIFMAFLRCNR